LTEDPQEAILIDDPDVIQTLTFLLGAVVTGWPEETVGESPEQAVFFLGDGLVE
jgi:hypothetical protein